MSCHACTDEPIPESVVQTSIVRSLERRDYTVIQQCVEDPTKFDNISSCKTHHMFGIDVVAQKGDELWIIEVKGKPRGSTGSSSTIFMAGLGQIMSRISSIGPGINYSIAIPNSPCFSPTVRKFIHSPALTSLNLSILLVQADDSFEIIR